MFIDSTTSKLIEVDFSFTKDSAFAKIPPAKYYEIEKRIKSQVAFEVTLYGRLYNYNMTFYPLLGQHLR